MTLRELVPIAGRSASALGTAVIALLVPKCPLCVAMYLTGFGLSATFSRGAAPFVRPVAFALVALAGVALTLAVWRARRRRVAPSCCGFSGV
ncbi:MAG: hypothetical protein QM756_16850 [Polyangiaceae bacterium]